jgi:hypothetical protein
MFGLDVDILRHVVAITLTSSTNLALTYHRPALDILMPYLDIFWLDAGLTLTFSSLMLALP